MKLCSRCGALKSRAEGFYQSGGRPKGECKDCTKALTLKWQQTHGRSSKSRGGKRRYAREKATSVDGRTETSFMQKFSRHGLTLDQYHAMAERQDFLCSICGEEPQPQNDRQGNVDNFVVDHDHQTNRVRSLTCWSCNAALGSFRDDPEITRKAALYLDKHHAQR